MIYKLNDNNNSNFIEFSRIDENLISIKIMDYETSDDKQEPIEVEVCLDKMDLFTLIGALHTIQKAM
jgi:hypothetical protein